MKGWMGLLTLVAFGCVNPPSVAFSPDGKQVAYAEPHVGLVIRDLSSQKVVGRYEVDSVVDLAWSPSGRFLVGSNTLPFDTQDSSIGKVRELDVKSGKMQLLPVRMVGPFGWSDDEKTLAGFVYPPEKNKSKTGDTEIVTYHFDSRTIDREDVGQGTPFGFIPGSLNPILIDDFGVYADINGKKKKLVGPSATYFPSGLTCVGDRGIIVSQSAWTQTHLTNSAASVDFHGHRRPIKLPSWLVISDSRNRMMTRLAAISPDERWAVVVRYEDLTRRPVLPLVAKEFAELQKSNSAASQEMQARLDRSSIRFVYDAVNLRMGTSKEIGAITGSGSDIILDLLTETQWSRDGKQASVSLDLGKRQRAWIFDATRGASRLIVSASEKK